MPGRVFRPSDSKRAGPSCDGQVVVTYDLLGLYDRLSPKFVKRYADVASVIRHAASDFVSDVNAGRFPGSEQTVAMDPEEAAKFHTSLGAG